MPSQSLAGASKYLNNLLLARGLLQDGRPINFADPTNDSKDDSEQNGSTTADATMARVINVVHDLVLRRDRDAEQRESLATMIRTMRAEDAQRVLDLQKLQDKNVQLKDRLSTADAQQRTQQSNTKRAQAEVKELKEQVVKMKSTLDQVRAKCISDVRKRDLEIEKLKHHMTGMQRGKKESSSGGMRINTINISQKSTNGREYRNGQEVTSQDKFGLENETNDFLAALVNETSTENVSLRKIVGDSMVYLKSLTGLDEEEAIERAEAGAEIDNAIGIPGQYRDKYTEVDFAQSASLVPVQELATSMSEVLGHCRTILRDPSFVPIEEVEARDAEIEKLRIGWEKMADRWKEAVTMMSQWRARMIHEGHGADLPDTDMEHGHSFVADGLSGFQNPFGRSVATRPDGKPVLDAVEEEELSTMLFEHNNAQNSAANISSISAPEEIHHSHISEPESQGTPQAAHYQPHQVSIIHEEQEPESDLDLTHPRPAASPARRGIKLSRPARNLLQPLSNANTNPRKRKSTEAASAHDLDHDSGVGTISPSDNHSSSMDPLAYSYDNGRDILAENDIAADGEDEDEDADLFIDENTVPSSSGLKSKIPRMTIAEKLAAVEAEASEATEVIRRRQVLGMEGDRGARRAQKSAATQVVEEKSTKKIKTGARIGGKEKSKVVEKERDVTKDKRRKTRDRRRSTLNPEELKQLMGQ